MLIIKDSYPKNVFFTKKLLSVHAKNCCIETEKHGNGICGGDLFKTLVGLKSRRYSTFGDNNNKS